MSPTPMPGTAAKPLSMRAPAGVLDGPIVPTLLRLALPTIVVLVVQTLVGVLETYFVGFLGTAALAGTALVFPVLMLMQMTSNGGIGGGTASAIARAIGAGRRADAEALAWHAIVIAIAFGTVFAVAAITCGPLLYRAMGGEHDTLAAALTYSNAVFAGAIPIWIVSQLSAVLRGAGNVKVPAIVTLISVMFLVPLSPALIFGFGPLPRLGVAGGGCAVVIYYLIGMAMLFAFMRSSRSPIRLTITPLSMRLFRDILGVGLLSAIGTLQSNLTVALVTAAVGRFGADAIAGYGLASRIDYMQIPIMFGLGTGLVTMVGVNTGAGQIARATRISWTGAGIAFAITQAIGIAAALFPAGWIGLFSHDPQVMADGALYLHMVAPFYGVVGAGMALYFAGQGAKRVMIPLLAGAVRLIVAAGIGWYAVAMWGVGLPGLFGIVAVSAVLFGGIIVVATFARTRSDANIAAAVQASAAE